MGKIKIMKISSAKNYNLLLAAVQIVFWCMLVMPPFLFRYNAQGLNFNDNSLYRIIINNLILAVIFYLNTYYYFPVYVKKRKWLTYFLILIITLTIAYLITHYIGTEVFPSKRKWKKSPFTDIFSFLFILGISCSYRIILDYFKTEKLNKEKETENLKTELSFLRSQVSPHFMFNVLNNLVSLARKKSDKMEPALLQLSALLRYMLYEGNHGKISLNQELNYIQGYIDLQKLRFGDDVDIVFTVKGEKEGFEIEPMILIPFVENAFKHGMGTIENPKILINLFVENDTLTFEVENEIAPIGESKDGSSGIGLINTKRRLTLLYPKSHWLTVSSDNKKYKVALKLKMHD